MAENNHLAREVGAKIKYLRQKRGLSQEALALSCDMNPAFLGHVERGMRSPISRAYEKDQRIDPGKPQANPCGDRNSGCSDSRFQQKSNIG